MTKQRIYTAAFVRSILVSALLLMSGVVGRADAAFLSHSLPTQSLLPVATVHCIFQDSEGFMWYGTVGGGLCRDNGYQVNVFRSDSHSPGLLRSNDISCMAEDSTGCIWFGTEKGLYKIDKRTYQLTEMLKGRELRVTALFLDSRRNMWVGSADGVFCINPASEKVLTHISDKKIGHVVQFLEDSRQRLWMVPWNWVPYTYDRSSRQLKKMPWALPSGIVRMREDAQQHGFWVATWEYGVVFYDTATGKTTTQPSTPVGKDAAHCVDMLIDSTQGLVWVTTLDNLYVYRRAGRTLIPLDTSAFLPPGRKILDGMCEDKAGNVWVAGFTPHTFIVTSSSRSTSRETIPAISAMTGFPLLADRMVADNDGCFWIWQGRTGLVHYDSRSSGITDISGAKLARGIAKDRSRSGIWAYAGTELLHLSYNGGRVTQNRTASLPEPISVIHDNSDGSLWIGTEKAVYRFSTSTHAMKKVCGSSAKVIAIDAAADGTVFFCNTGKELVRLTADGRSVTLPNLRHEDFTSLALSPDGTLWCATQQGSVYFLTAGAKTLERHNQMSTPNGDAIICVKADRAGHVWLLSNQYLREYNPRNNAFRTLRNTDSDIAVSYFYNLETVDDNRIAADGAGAYLLFESSKMLDQQAARGVHPCITSVDTGDSVRLLSTMTKSIDIPSDVHSVIMSCSTFDPVNARRVSFAYKIEGWNKEWVYLPEGVNTIYLNNLPKGDYRLLLRATDSYGCWSAEETVYSLQRLPSWWETWWAVTLFALAAAAIGYGLWRLNLRIRLLLVLQQKRKSLALTEVQVKPEELARGQEQTEMLLKQVTEKIEEHLDDADYSVEQLSSDMCMSRMSLYRKVQTLTGLSPNEFMRDIRLKKAATILKRHPDITIAQLAAKVGFLTPQYFSKCFKKKFGMLPSQYVKDKQK